MYNDQLRSALNSLKNTLQEPVVTRFAPSPSGQLHLGHLASVLFVWGIAKALNGKVILRIEDHDKQRSRKNFEHDIVEILDWFGFIPDMGCSLQTLDCQSEYRQSNKNQRYQEVAQFLLDEEQAYFCKCSRQQILARRSQGEQEEVWYDGFCRTLQYPCEINAGLRVKMPNQDYQVRDFWLGVQNQNPTLQCGDFLIKDRNGNWTYQFAVVIDDYDQKVNLVIRGQDLTHAMARQHVLHQMIGSNKPPFFLHHPLIMDPVTKRKLSKRDLSVSLNQLRDQGIRQEILLGDAAFKVGLIPEFKPLSLYEVMSLFDV